LESTLVDLSLSSDLSSQSPQEFFKVSPLRNFSLSLCLFFLSLSFFTDFVGVLAGIKNLTVFADGCLVGHNNGIWHAAKWISFSGQTKIIAVSVYNEPKWAGGFLGVFSNGVVTDRSWKCKEANSPEDGWEQTSFNDDAWPDAYMSFNNSVTRSYGVPSSTYWIHPANNRAVRFFCRRRFSTEEGNINSSKYQENFSSFSIACQPLSTFSNLISTSTP